MPKCSSLTATKSAIKKSAEKGIKKRVAELEKSIQAGQENIRRRIEELHTLLKKAGKNAAY